MPLCSPRVLKAAVVDLQNSWTRVSRISGGMAESLVSAHGGGCGSPAWFAECASEEGVMAWIGAAV